jgi:hypothetical protein
MDALRAVYKYWTAVLFAGVLVQVGAAGYGSFYAAKKSDPGPLTRHGFEHGFSFHRGFGYIIFVAAAILLVLALGARLGKTRVLWALGALLVVAIQIVLAWAGEDHEIVGIFHGVVALLVVGLTGFLAHRAWRGARTTT